VERRIHRSAADVFEFVEDYRNVSQVLEGVTSWKPIGDKARGEGARYRISMGALGLSLSTEMRIDLWKDGEALGWVSDRSPVWQQGRWTFTRVSADVTQVELRIKYRPPAGGIGNFVSARLEGIIRTRIVAALEKMKDVLEDGE